MVLRRLGRYPAQSISATPVPPSRCLLIRSGSSIRRPSFGGKYCTSSLRPSTVLGSGQVAALKAAREAVSSLPVALKLALTAVGPYLVFLVPKSTVRPLSCI